MRIEFTKNKFDENKDRKESGNIILYALNYKGGKVHLVNDDVLKNFVGTYGS